MNSEEDIEDIRSVNIRSIAIKKRLLMSHEMVATFEEVLKDYIQSEVLIVNTNTGMEVYYYSAEDHFLFIKETISSYFMNYVNVSGLKFRNNCSKEEVKQSFCDAFFTFSKYPQLFLAYAKKFRYLQVKNEDSLYILPILTDFFENALYTLRESGHIPHGSKIRPFQSSNEVSTVLDTSVIKKLISEILLKLHSN